MRLVLAITIAVLLLLATKELCGVPVTLFPTPEGPLEESVQNEVDHAIYLGNSWLKADPARMAATNLPPATIDLFSTNNASRLALALRLISSQRIAASGGFWEDPRPTSITNRVTATATTRLALVILKGL